MKRALLIVLCVAGLVLVALVAKAVLVVVQGDDELGAPPTARLLPVPDGTNVILNRTSRSEGSLGADQRLLVLATPNASAPASRVTESYLESLRSRGWTSPQPSAALSPDSEICLTAVPLVDYLADPARPERTKQVLRDLNRPADSIAVITAILC
ncbi:MAG: hypothetical protein M3203_10915 [Actinomycetota bacterium]|nr:hypothetical protein [Actinomycetota bacterium]